MRAFVTFKTHPKSLRLSSDKLLYVLMTGKSDMLDASLSNFFRISDREGERRSSANLNNEFICFGGFCVILYTKLYPNKI